jgi:DNA-directed RNA polymerase sigma subunit (sigma70/sigma32)
MRAARRRSTSSRQIASIGLLNAIDRYDPENGSAFTSYAMPTMHGEQMHVSRVLRGAIGKLHHVASTPVAV